VFSLRRVAGAVSRTVAGGRLRTELDAVLGQPLYAGTVDGTCLAVRDPAGRLLYTRQLDKALIPASNLKLLTAAVALAKFGPDFRYVTPVRSPSPPAGDGSVGDLWLVGSGDPLLATADFAAIAGWLERPRPATPIEGLADRIVNAGVKRIGRILGDETRFDTQRYLPTWAPNYATDPDIGPQSALQLNGGFVQWRPKAIPQTAPATNGATVLASLLRARGVTVGGVGEGRAPENGVTVAQIESPPMAEVVGVMLRDSDNLVAELIVKELGARFANAGTTAGGLTVERTVAIELGLPARPLILSDGSGLDRGNRLSCELIDSVLAHSGEDSPIGKGLSVAGSIGTLTRRFVNTPAAGKVKAKTGSLDGVTSLSGWTTGVRGGDLQFALLANDLPYDAAGTALQNQLVNVLAGYPNAPAPEDIGPLPVRPPPGPAVASRPPG
jgi:D-alanyl-D-alanine carboxypeptidase/D-alanyl-D-alanine-endopeptidase (penicillin-binding protein 4)